MPVANSPNLHSRQKFSSDLSPSASSLCLSSETIPSPHQMPASTPYLSTQTPSHVTIYLPTAPKQHTLTDSHLVYHGINGTILAVDFFAKVRYWDAKVEKCAVSREELLKSLREELNILEMDSVSLAASLHQQQGEQDNDSESQDTKSTASADASLPQWIQNGKKPVYQLILPKQEPAMWPHLQLSAEQLQQRDTIIERRREAMERRSQWEKEQREKLRKQKIEEEKRLFEKQWDMEKERRGTIEKQKETEREEMRKDIRQFAEEVEEKKPEVSSDTTTAEATQKPSQSADASSSEREIFTEKDTKPKARSKPRKKGNNFLNKLGDLYPDAPKVRHSAAPVKISFTPRVLRSAARQDKDAEILQKFEIWKKKNRPERLEDNPAWIKQRGDKFFAREDYLAAINAYTAALEIDPDFLLCYANRAACHLNRKEYAECIEDCNRFLVTRPDETSGASSHSTEKIVRAMIKVFARRGSAYYHIGETKRALRDYEMALQMDQQQGGQKDSQLEADYERMKQDIDSRTDGDASSGGTPSSSLKQQGDAAFKSNRLQDAIDFYTKAINMRQDDAFACRSNRAACLLKIGSLDKCVNDCTFIIDNLFASGAADSSSGEAEEDSASDKSSTTAHNTSTATSGPSTGLMLKAYVRRGTCYSLMGNFQESYADYTAASRIAPHDESLLRDMEKINKRLQSQIHADWYKNRGNFFFQQEEYETAIRSYDLAVKADDTNPIYLANRAQCHMKLKNYLKCIRDIEAAFNARVPEWYLKKHAQEIKEKGGEEKVTEVDAIPANPNLTSQLQLKLFMRRGTCYKLMDEIKHAYSDFRNAARLSPNNKIVKEELKQLEPLFQEIVEKEKEEHRRKQQQEQEEKSAAATAEQQSNAESAPAVSAVA